MYQPQVCGADGRVRCTGSCDRCIGEKSSSGSADRDTLIYSVSLFFRDRFRIADLFRRKDVLHLCSDEDMTESNMNDLALDFSEVCKHDRRAEEAGEFNDEGENDIVGSHEALPKP